MFIVVILSLFVAGDLAWTAYVWSRFRQPEVRRSAVARVGLGVYLTFLAVTVGCLAVSIIARGTGQSVKLPVPLLSLVFLWHLLVLPVTIVATAFGHPLSLLVRRLTGRSGTDVAPVAAEEAAGGSPDVSRRAFLAAAVATTPPVATGLLAAFSYARLENLRVRTVQVPVAGLPVGLEGFSIAHLTDTHLGDFTPARHYRRFIDITNSLKADVIVHTGDVINVDSNDIPEAMAGLGKLEARHGVYLCEGNHDLIQSPRRFWDAARALPNVRFLRGEAGSLMFNGVPVQIAGLPWTGRRAPTNATAPAASSDAVPHADAHIERACGELADAIHPDAFAVLLAHHPHAFDFAPWARLTLAGHTHGGQLMLAPGVGPGPIMYRYYSGLYAKGERSVFVSNGAGNWFPLRTNAPAEIVKLVLRRA